MQGRQLINEHAITTFFNKVQETQRDAEKQETDKRDKGQQNQTRHQETAVL